MDMDLLQEELERDEGIRQLMYKDSVGLETIGIGHNLTKPISMRAVDQIFQDDVQNVMWGLDRSLPWWRGVSEARQRVLVNMAFNMGVAGLLEFKDTLAKISSGQYAAAADAMLQSEWAKQVGLRASRLSQMMREG